jgi:hypothetical protein
LQGPRINPVSRCPIFGIVAQNAYPRTGRRVASSVNTSPYIPHPDLRLRRHHHHHACRPSLCPRSSVCPCVGRPPSLSPPQRASATPASVVTSFVSPRSPASPATFDLHSITAASERLLWHQRLCHPSDHYLYNANRFIDGVPKFHHMDPIFDVCPTGVRAKQKKKPAGFNSKIATRPTQGPSMDFSFTGMSQRHTSRQEEFDGLTVKLVGF